jgi:hypothetical protein
MDRRRSRNATGVALASLFDRVGLMRSNHPTCAVPGVRHQSISGGRDVTA